MEKNGSVQNGIHKNGVQKNGVANGKSKIGICFTTQTALYEHTEDVKPLTNGYTSTDTQDKVLRNRVFIDNNPKDQS